MPQFFNDHLSHDWQHSSDFILLLAASFLGFLFLIVKYIRRRATFNYLDTGFNSASTAKLSTFSPVRIQKNTTHDTLFILPDISNYTRFMANSHFDSRTSQFIVFTLINAMVEVATKTMSLSKIEGDAALFFVDHGKYSNKEIGDTIVEIFEGFDRAKQKLMNSDICACAHCPHIDQLEIKVFVHRGTTERYRFREAIDHFGKDIILLHRLMKNNIASDRYCLVTQKSLHSVRLPDDWFKSDIVLNLGEIGEVSTLKFEQSKIMEKVPMPEYHSANVLPGPVEYKARKTGNNT